MDIWKITFTCIHLLRSQVRFLTCNAKLRASSPAAAFQNCLRQFHSLAACASSPFPSRALSEPPGSAHIQWLDGRDCRRCLSLPERRAGEFHGRLLASLYSARARHTHRHKFQRIAVAVTSDQGLCGPILPSHPRDTKQSNILPPPLVARHPPRGGEN